VLDADPVVARWDAPQTENAPQNLNLDARKRLFAMSGVSVEFPASDPPSRPAGQSAARVRASRLEHAVGHLSAADVEAEAAEFERGLDAARKYVAVHGGTDLPHGYVDETGFPLVWVAAQREAHLEDRLAGSCRAALQNIPGWQWAPGDGRGRPA
jgi:hypothetical protein